VTIGPVAEVLEETYDLRYRPRPGEASDYRVGIVYRSLDARGAVLRREAYEGRFRRDVEAVLPDGRVQERITWRGAARREARGEEPFGDAEPLPYLEGFAYPFSAEDGYEEYHWQHERFPRDMTGWFAMLLTIDAHFEFDFLRSSRHGAIERLRRIGDSVLAPDSGKPFAIHFLPLFDVPGFTKQDLRTTFAGLTRHGDEPCALLAFSTGMSTFEIVAGGATIPCTSRFSGTLKVRLSDGALEHGEFTEWVFNPAAASSGVACNSPVYEINRL
jgi:hypothetical protein